MDTRKPTTFEEGVQFARLAAEAGADAIQVRAHGYGHRGGLLQPDRLFYPNFRNRCRKTWIGVTVVLARLFHWPKL